MNIFKALFSSNQLMETITKGADELHHSPEEKASHQERMLGLYAPFKLAQRLLMLTICVPYVVCFVITWAISFTGHDVSDQFAMLNGDIGTSFIAVVLFYFGGGAVEGIASKLQGRFFNKPNA